MGDFTGLGLYALVLLATGAAMLGLAHLLGPHLRRKAKMAPYECGVPLLGTAREQFSVRFYLVAILFVLFDVETVFLVPWAVLFRRLGVAGFVEMAVFLAVLGWGLFYVWKRGVLDWQD